MASIYSDRLFNDSFRKANRVKVFDTSGIPALLTFSGFPSANVIVTGVGFGQQAGVQFMQTLERVVYVYAFGERMGVVQISGIALLSRCNAGGWSGDSTNGIADIFSFYKENSVSQRSQPMSLSIGRVSMKGFLTGINSTVTDAESGTVGFSITIATLPDLWVRV